MKKNELQNLKEKNIPELVKELQISKDRLWKLALDLESGKVNNVSEIRKLKKAIAAMKTLLKEKELKSAENK